jgi:hypothetical protein
MQFSWLNDQLVSLYWPASVTQLVDQSTHDPKLKGSNTVAIGTGRKVRKEVKVHCGELGYMLLPNRLFQISQTGGQWYSDTYPFSIPCRRIQI